MTDFNVPLPRRFQRNEPTLNILKRDFFFHFMSPLP